MGTSKGLLKSRRGGDWTGGGVEISGIRGS